MTLFLKSRRYHNRGLKRMAKEFHVALFRLPALPHSWAIARGPDRFFSFHHLLARAKNKRKHTKWRLKRWGFAQLNAIKWITQVVFVACRHQIFSKRTNYWMKAVFASGGETFQSGIIFEFTLSFSRSEDKHTKKQFQIEWKVQETTPKLGDVFRGHMSVLKLFMFFTTTVVVVIVLLAITVVRRPRLAISALKSVSVSNH